MRNDEQFAAWRGLLEPKIVGESAEDAAPPAPSSEPAAAAAAALAPAPAEPLERQPSMTGFLGALRAERDRKASSGPTLVGGLPEEEEGEEPPKKPQSFLNSVGSFLSGGSA